jgi:hypothetical protein
MCYCTDNTAKAYREVERKARKAHRCYECRAPIEIGETYTFISGIWDDGPESYRWCVSCTKLCAEANALDRETRQHGFDDFCFVMGDLLECTIEFASQREDEIRYRALEEERRKRYATVVMAGAP